MKFLLSALFISLLLMTACGQTGDLVLPPEYHEQARDKKSTQKPVQ